MTVNIPCGGCGGFGSHRMDCLKNPAHNYRRVLARRAKSLADEIGSNDPAAANLVYAAQAQLLSSQDKTEQQNKDGTWSTAKPIRGSWWVRLERWVRRQR